MKFCFLSSFAHLALDPRADRVSGGAELQVALLARELVRLGHEAAVIGGDTGQLDGEVFEGVKTRTGGAFHTGAIVDTLRAIPRVHAVLREERPDFVCVLGWTTWMFLLDRMKHRLRYRSVFICGLDTEVNGEFRRQNPVRGFFFEEGIRSADFRFAMSEYQREQFQRRGEPCGFYRNLILPRSGPLNARKDIDLLWVARCQAIKQPHRFLDLVERVPDAVCHMVAPREDVALWETVRDRAARLQNLTFEERVPYREVQDRYDRARVFVNTSEWEGFPNSFIQAGQGRAAILSLSVNPDGLFDAFPLGRCSGNDFDRFVTDARVVLSESSGQMALASERFVVEWHDNRRNVQCFLAGLA